MTTSGDWLQILDPVVLPCLPQVRHVLFDFDGTISVLREGWESVMVPLMIEKICGETPPSSEIEAEVREYVDRSTGILTIEQMGWLVEAVKRHGLAGEPRAAAEYKSLYLKRLLLRVEKRVESLEQGLAGAEERMVFGAVEFIQALYLRGVKLYLASGTDHADVLREAHALGMHRFFNGNIYGALDQNNAHNKSHVIQRIMDEHSLGGPELMVVGDGPVEIREAVARGAIALGVASDEILRQGWNSSKIARLKLAGAHLLIPDFTGWEALIDLLTQSSDPFNQPRSKA
jgi:phosphoglycolate phosphatase-like HAD superfamily hydrolase